MADWNKTIQTKENIKEKIFRKKTTTSCCHIVEPNYLLFFFFLKSFKKYNKNETWKIKVHKSRIGFKDELILKNVAPI